MKIGLICDSHMPQNPESAQWQFCLKGSEAFKADGISKVITLGDITSFGEIDALQSYLNMFSSFEHSFVLGNSDARDPKTVKCMEENHKGFSFVADNRKFLGVNSMYAKLNDDDKKAISELSDGDVLILHHPPERLYNEEDRMFLNDIFEKKALTVLYAHLHRTLFGEKGKTKLFGIRAIDPDKSFGDFPCVTYFDTETNSVEEKLLTISKDEIAEIGNYFGISCVDNHRDVEYATTNKLYGIELRCNGKGWEPDSTLLPKINKWREAGGKYLSIHMPNLYWKENKLVGVETWYKAVEYANFIGADGMTMHPPRVKLCEFSESEKAFLEIYQYAVNNVGDHVKICIENLHMTKGETCDEDRAFGYKPSEVIYWKDAVKQNSVNPERVGHTLDVGHARNNGYLASEYPISRWYETLGKNANAYHIHQVMMKEEGLKNHNAIEDWFGPQISYVSFFYQWKVNQIKRSPIFLEVKGCENVERSINAFKKAFM